MQEAVTRKTIIERSEEVFVAADNSKFGRYVPIGIAHLDKIDYIITECYLDKSMVNNFKKIKTKIILAED
jgi:DeoR/GlpR family transcriptional regulator of sugar metabolism